MEYRSAHTGGLQADSKDLIPMIRAVGSSREPLLRTSSGLWGRTGALFIESFYYFVKGSREHSADTEQCPKGYWFACLYLLPIAYGEAMRKHVLLAQASCFAQ